MGNTPTPMVVARGFAQYYIGDETWADMIIRAYLNPEVAWENLREEMGDDN